MKCGKIVACVLAGVLAAGFSAGCHSGGSSQSDDHNNKNDEAITANIPADSPFAQIKIDMSQDEVISILKLPTDTENRITGKAFMPFNFSGGGTRQTVLHYKGMGRIILENDNAYHNVNKVTKVEYDPTESGFAK